MFRVMTYNVHRCVGVDGRLDVGRIAAVIAHCKPDIVALQELDVGRARTGGVDQAHAIAQRLGMSFHFHPAMRVEEERYGDAILTEAPLTVMKADALPGSATIRGLEPRGALWLKVQLEGQPVNIINTHFGLVPHEQRAQAAALCGSDWLGQDGCGDPVVLVGDFNATPRYSAYRMLAARLRGAHLPVAVPGPGHRPRLRLRGRGGDKGVDPVGAADALSFRSSPAARRPPASPRLATGETDRDEAPRPAAAPAVAAPRAAKNPWG